MIKIMFKINIEKYLRSKVTAPATTGDATLVPESDLHPLLHFEKCIRIKGLNAKQMQYGILQS
jgi:hypothetical protein